MSHSTQDTSDNGSRMSRRNLLHTAVITPTLLVAAGFAGAADAPTATSAEPSLPGIIPSAAAFTGNHELKPLSFDPARLKGLSARLIESHWSNNYGGSIRALNGVKTQLAAALSARDTPNFLYNGLKREHLMRSGSVILHELYFDNLGGSGTAGATMRSAISDYFASFDEWLDEFRRISLGLGGGSGWVALAWNRHFGLLENYWMADHMHYPAGSEPLLVIDLYEHSYQMDYGAATARYVDAFFDNLNWDVVQARFERARS